MVNKSDVARTQEICVPARLGQRDEEGSDYLWRRDRFDNPASVGPLGCVGAYSAAVTP